MMMIDFDDSFRGSKISKIVGRCCIIISYFAVNFTNVGMVRTISSSVGSKLRTNTTVVRHVLSQCLQRNQRAIIMY